MHCFLTDCSPLEDDDLFGRAYSELSEARREKADRCGSGNDRRLSVAAGLFIRSVERHFGKVGTDENGKPHTEGIEFSLSHSGRYVAFAVSDSPVGVDIERTGRIAGIAERVMTPSEYDEMIGTVSEDDREDVLCRMWTAKESYMKALGTGFRLPPESFRVLYGHDIRCPDSGMCIQELDAPDGYRLSVCSADRDIKAILLSVDDLIGKDPLGVLFSTEDAVFSPAHSGLPAARVFVSGDAGAVYARGTVRDDTLDSVLKREAASDFL